MSAYVLDLFCGCGGMSLGMTQQGFDIALGVDIDPVHAGVPDTHSLNFDHPILIGDLCSKDVLDRLYLELPEPAVITGGPPCQGFSSIGKRDPTDLRNDLIRQFARTVCLLRPKFFVMENVPGLMRGYGKKYLDDFIKRVEDGGYVVTKPVRLLNAADFGVPQSRKRVFVLGTRKDLGIELPYPTQKLPPTTVWDAIGDLPTGMDCENLADYPIGPRSLTGMCQRLAKRKSRRLRTAYGTAFLAECSGNRRSKHTQKTIDLYASTAPGDIVPRHRLPRLERDGLCPTLRAGTDSKRGAHTAARPVHPFEPRCITVREAARLHGYPDWFEFDSKLYNAYRQIGNSVCPPVANAIAGEIVKCLLERMQENDSIDLINPNKP